MLGATGQVGRSLAELAWPDGIEATFRNREQVDLACSDSIAREFAANRYDLVINAAAYTNVEGAEDHQEAAFRVNADGPALLALHCAQMQACLIHLSTDYVFDGTFPGDHGEGHTPHPLGAYARSKEAGETAVRDTLDHHVILRTAWVYSAHGTNFLKTMLRIGAARDELNVVDDQHGNPTPACAIAYAAVAVAEQVLAGKPHWGTYHFAGTPATTWYDFANAIFASAESVWGRRPTLSPISAKEWPSKVERPANTRLNCALIEHDYGIAAPDWRKDVAILVKSLES